jgi:UDP-N-acetylmuramate--alanine ligase
VKFGLEKLLNKRDGLFTYSLETENADFHISAMKLISGIYQFSIFGPNLKIENVQLEMPGKLNVENALAAAAAAFIAGASETEIKTALANFSGVKRRMEYIIKRTDFVYLDDYAHHPEELKASILSVRELFPTKKISGIFQPHLFSRTRDFIKEFAQSLALLDSLILLDIYPAREEPISGVTSALLLENISLEDKILLQKEELIPYLKKQPLEVLITLGAGDIDRMVDPIKRAFE